MKVSDAYFVPSPFTSEEIEGVNALLNLSKTQIAHKSDKKLTDFAISTLLTNNTQPSYNPNVQSTIPSSSTHLTAILQPKISNDEKWQSNFEKLVTYKQMHGHCNVKKTEDLGTWVKTQRQKYKNERNKFLESRIAQLESIGFIWDMKSNKKQKSLPNASKEHSPSAAIHFSNEETCSDVPPSGNTSFPLVEKLAANPEENVLEIVDIEIHNNNDNNSNLRSRHSEQAWEAHFNELISYLNNYGHLKVCDKTFPTLASWCAEQRTAYQKETMPPEKRGRLDAIGFNWQTQPYDRKTKIVTIHFKKPSKAANSKHFDTLWQTHYLELVNFKNAHQHCSPKSKENKSLATWVFDQRTALRTGKMTKQRYDLLNEIGFDWGSLHVQTKKISILDLTEE